MSRCESEIMLDLSSFNLYLDSVCIRDGVLFFSFGPILYRRRKEEIQGFSIVWQSDNPVESIKSIQLDPIQDDYIYIFMRDYLLRVDHNTGLVIEKVKYPYSSRGFGQKYMYGDDLIIIQSHSISKWNKKTEIFITLFPPGKDGYTVPDAFDYGHISNLCALIDRGGHIIFHSNGFIYQLSIKNAILKKICILIQTGRNRDGNVYTEAEFTEPHFFVTDPTSRLVCCRDTASKIIRTINLDSGRVSTINLSHCPDQFYLSNILIDPRDGSILIMNQKRVKRIKTIDTIQYDFARLGDSLRRTHRGNCKTILVGSKLFYLDEEIISCRLRSLL